MSREIKFRAWNEEQKQMALVSSLHSSMNIHVSYKKGEEKKGYFFGGNWVGADWNKDNSILMQFTGLKDKNGIDIYEGDKIKCTDAHGETWITTIRFSEGAFLVDCENLDYNITAIGFLDEETEIEVIGNIHENK
jgi:uncharacterized phage protein (TIGR01671 family)